MPGEDTIPILRLWKIPINAIPCVQFNLNETKKPGNERQRIPQSPFKIECANAQIKTTQEGVQTKQATIIDSNTISANTSESLWRRFRSLVAFK